MRGRIARCRPERSDELRGGVEAALEAYVDYRKLPVLKHSLRIFYSQIRQIFLEG